MGAYTFLNNVYFYNAANAFEITILQAQKSLSNITEEQSAFMY